VISLSKSDIDQAIIDASTQVLLRYFRGGTQAQITQATLNLAQDMDILQLHWAISDKTLSFLQYIIEHKHEAQSLLQLHARVDDAMIKGRIDAVGTYIERRMSGNSSRVKFYEPKRSYDTGPNQLLCWLIIKVSRILSQFTHIKAVDAPYQNRINRARQYVGNILRIEPLQESLKYITLAHRPTLHTLQSAKRSRQHIYAKASESFESLTAIENGDEETIISVLNSTLIAPLEDWRRFELVTGFLIAEAMSKAKNTPLRLNLLPVGHKGPLALVGDISVYWQQNTKAFQNPELEPSEIKISEALSDYGMGASTDRPDLIILDESSQDVVSVVEVKYLAGDSFISQFRQAVSQIIRYTRNYTPPETWDQLIEKSIVVMSARVPERQSHDGFAPSAMDFQTLLQPKLEAWAEQLLS
jgi:hypothetical protein